MADHETTRLPGPSRAGGYLYVVQFNSGVVKVGRTMNPSARLKSHATGGRPHGISVVAQWLSQPHLAAKRNERLLIAFCRSRYRSVNDGEFFVGAEPDQVVAYAEDLRASATCSDALRFQQYGRNAGKGGSWPEEDPVAVVRLSGDLANRIDAVRGDRSRAEWLHDFVQSHLPPGS